mmetsp:Transcript_35832/g.84924  ORF Transcript_35832/g.84924 Transcript_35832/m.84924 type:complete len:208 (+) Transcript_35832:1404-2027(+)
MRKRKSTKLAKTSLRRGILSKKMAVGTRRAGLLWLPRRARASRPAGTPRSTAPSGTTTEAGATMSTSAPRTTGGSSGSALAPRSRRPRQSTSLTARRSPSARSTSALGSASLGSRAGSTIPPSLRSGSAIQSGRARSPASSSSRREAACMAPTACSTIPPRRLSRETRRATRSARANPFARSSTCMEGARRVGSAATTMQCDGTRSA